MSSSPEHDVARTYSPPTGGSGVPRTPSIPSPQQAWVPPVPRETFPSGHSFNEHQQGGSADQMANLLRQGGNWTGMPPTNPPVNPSSMPNGMPQPQGSPNPWLQHLFSGMGGQYGG